MVRGNDTFSRSDRDLLIRVDTKVDALTQTVKELNDGTATRLAKMETKHETDFATISAKLESIDIYHAKIEPNMPVYDDNSRWVTSLRGNLKLIAFFYSLFQGVITVLIIWLLQIIFKIKL